MDSIIGLLFLILPVLFSLIGKKLEKAGDGAEDAQEVPSMPEVFPTLERMPQRPKPQEEAVSALPKQQVSEAAPSKVAKPYKVIEEEKPRRKEPVDPKKLVVYSEIMKPKYLE